MSRKIKKIHVKKSNSSFRKTGIVSTKLTKTEVREISKLCTRWHVHMGGVVRVLLRLGLKEIPSWSNPTDFLGSKGIFKISKL